MSAETLHILDSNDIQRDIARCVQSLRQGEVVVLPTETVYGAAGVLNHPSARQKLLNIRGKNDKPLTIHLGSRQAAEAYIGPVNELAARMMRKLWPGPVGLQFDVPADRRAEVAKSLQLQEQHIYDNGSITLRMPDHPVTGEIISQVAGPVVLTGVGDPLPKIVSEQASYIVNTGATQFSKPSTIVKVNGSKWEIVRAGIFDERIIKKLLQTTIVFVCSGNTCRSPMAEALARKFLSQKLNIPQNQLEDRGITVTSAGTFAFPGSRATPQAVTAVSELGADLSKHRSRALSVELIHQADAIFTMGRSHLATVVSLVPSAVDKARTLSPDGDIEDPIGSDVSVYKALAVQFESLLARQLDERLFPPEK